MLPSTKTILEKLRASERLSRADALSLLRAADTEELTAAAHELRLKLVPKRRVTYLVDRNVNYTNACITDCSFCAFYRPPNHAEAYTLSYEEIFQKIHIIQLFPQYFRPF